MSLSGKQGHTAKTEMLARAEGVIKTTERAFVRNALEFLVAHFDTKLDRLKIRRFFLEHVLSCHRHKHIISPAEYIGLLIMGAGWLAISN